MRIIHEYYQVETSASSCIDFFNITKKKGEAYHVFYERLVDHVTQNKVKADALGKISFIILQK